MASSTRDDNLIFDIGMHKGEDTDFYLKKGFRVIGVEANPELVGLCHRRFRKACESGQLAIIDKAIADDSGPIDFYVNHQKSEWGTANRDWMVRNRKAGKPSRAIQVQTIRASDLIREFGVPYYMKVDIEGSDHLCLASIKNLSEKPRYVSVEAHAYARSETLRLLNALIEADYKKFNIVPQLRMGATRCPSPACEGKYVEHMFPEGASGLFGRELPGPWLSASETIARFKIIYRNIRVNGPHNGLLQHVRNRYTASVLNRLFPDSDNWYDIHATV